MALLMNKLAYLESNLHVSRSAVSASTLNLEEDVAAGPQEINEPSAASQLCCSECSLCVDYAMLYDITALVLAC